VVGLGQLATVADIDEGWQKAVAATFTILLAVASVLAYILDYRAKAIQHRFAARQYAALRRTLERLSELPADSPEVTWRTEDVHRLWDAAASAAPNSPAHIREQAKQRFKERHGGGSDG
jgi:hypothetical protein